MTSTAIWCQVAMITCLGAASRGMAQPLLVHLRAGTLGFAVHSVQNANGRAGEYGIAEISLPRPDRSSLIFGYRRAVGEELRPRLEGAHLGLRLHGWSRPYAASHRVGSHRISHRPRIVPFAEAAISAGQYLVYSLGNDEVFDVSSPFYGLIAGGGIRIAISSAWAMELYGAAHRAWGRNGPVTFAAVDTTLAVGLVYALGSGEQT